MSLLSGLDVVKKETKRDTANSTQLDIIKASVNKVIHEHLLTEFPEFYFDGSGTIIAKKDKDGLLKDNKTIGGSNTYRLFIPIEDKVTLTDGNNKKVLANACRVGNPTLYSDGITNWVTEYVRKNGTTHLWNRKEGKFTETTEK